MRKLIIYILLLVFISISLTYLAFWRISQSTKNTVLWVESNGGNVESDLPSWFYEAPKILQGFIKPAVSVEVKSISLFGTQVSDISNLSNLRSITNLDLSGTQVKDISHLRNLTSLCYLDLSGTQVKDISHLRNLTSLNYLNISETQVSNIRFLANLQKLKYLYMYNTLISFDQVKDISSKNKNLNVLSEFKLPTP